jgi:hypothetical protein
MTNLSQEPYMEYLEDEYLTNSYSLVVKGCEFEQYDNELIEPNNILLENCLPVFDNRLEEFYNKQDSFESYSNDTIEPNLTLLNINSPNNDILDVFDNNLETSHSSSIYQYNLHIGDVFDDWKSVDTFIYQYCLERGFGYQIF